MRVPEGRAGVRRRRSPLADRGGPAGGRWRTIGIDSSGPGPAGGTARVDAKHSGAHMSVSSGPAAERSMAAFRRRIDTFFGDPRTAEFADGLRPPSPLPPTTAAAALRARLDDVLSRLGIEPAAGTLRL